MYIATPSRLGLASIDTRTDQVMFNHHQPLTTATLKLAFARSNPMLDPADVEDAFESENRADAMLLEEPTLWAALGGIDASQCLPTTPLQMLGDLLRAENEAIKREQRSELRLDVRRRMDEATVLPYGAPATREDPNDSLADELIDFWIAEFWGEPFTVEVLDRIADEVTGYLNLWQNRL